MLPVVIAESGVTTNVATLNPSLTLVWTIVALAGGAVIVYAAEPIAESMDPALTARAFNVSDVAT
jgi:hypothetical protein